MANCGPVFIMNFDLTNYSEFVELSPKEILSIFLKLSEFPSFKHSALYSSTEKLVDDTDDDDDSEEESIT